ncbi:MAG: M36 family metallopeptidase [Thermoanaerobaculia bacterium]
MRSAPLFQAGEGSAVGQALALVREDTGGLAVPGELVEWVPDPRVYRTSAGTEVVHLHQHYRGVPVFEAMRTVHRDPDGASQQVTGDVVPLPKGLAVEPELGAPDALLAAARHLAERAPELELDISGRPPRVLAVHALPAEPTALGKRPFEGPVLAHLTLFDLGAEVCLGWYLSVRLPALRGSWDFIVQAHGEEAGRVLWSRETSSRARPARGLVFIGDSDQPGAQRARLGLDFPQPLNALPPLRPCNPLPAGFPHLWVTDRNTLGNNVRAERFGGGSVQGALSGGRAVFEPAASSNLDQQILNAFYFCNILHDLFYLLGFDEAAGNLQDESTTGTGRNGDPLEVSIVRLVPRGDAQFEVQSDGRRPRLALGETAAGRHTALSADVVFHEYVHGVTDRLVGGRVVFHTMQQSRQSRALDEGLCDWFALTVQSHAQLVADPAAPERLVFGAWAANDAQRGLRLHSYRNYPFRFGDLRRQELAEPHAAGQVWCAALLAMNRGLGQVVGDTRRGHEIGWQVVVDALKRMSKTPLSVTFLAARDEIFGALADLVARPPIRADGSPLVPPGAGNDLTAAVRAAFRQLGMGDAARGAGPRFEDAVGDPP